jgi:hypothetical protein
MAGLYEDVSVCTTPGDALDAVYIFDHKFDKKTQSLSSTIRISHLNDTHQDYKTKFSLHSLKDPNFVEVIIGKAADSIDFGGASNKSIMMAFSKNMKEAKLAEGSRVYHLSCKQYDRYLID